MTIWDSICHSQWFKQTSIVRVSVELVEMSLTSFQILFLNKNDLFQRKIPHSDIKNFFPVRMLSALVLEVRLLSPLSSTVIASSFTYILPDTSSPTS